MSNLIYVGVNIETVCPIFFLCGSKFIRRHWGKKTWKHFQGLCLKFMHGIFMHYDEKMNVISFGGGQAICKGLTLNSNIVSTSWATVHFYLKLPYHTVCIICVEEIGSLAAQSMYRGRYWSEEKEFCLTFMLWILLWSCNVIFEYLFV